MNFFILYGLFIVLCLVVGRMHSKQTEKLNQAANDMRIASIKHRIRVAAEFERALKRGQPPTGEGSCGGPRGSSSDQTNLDDRQV